MSEQPKTRSLGWMLLGYLKPYRWIAASLLFALLFESGVESLTRFSFRYLIDEAVVPRSVPKLTMILSFLGVTGVLLTAVCILADYLWAKLGSQLVADLRSDLFRHVQRLSVDFFGRRTSGDILSCFMADAQAIESCLVMVVPYGTLGVAGICFSMSMMASINPQLATAALVGLAVCFFLPRFLSARANQAALEMRNQEGRLSNCIQESIQSQSVVKVFGLEKELLRRFSSESQATIDISVKANFFSYIVQRVPSLCFFLLCLLILGGSAVLAFRGQLSIGQVVSFQVLVLGLGGAIANLTWLTPTVVHAAASLERINEVLREMPQVEEHPFADRLPALSREIRFENIDFVYPEAETRSLNGISLTVKQGEFVVLVGPSGAGKTSLLHLLLRLYDPSGGRVLVDGVDLRTASLDSLRSQIGLVSQDVVLFNSSIRDNVRMGKLDATEAEIWAALEAAELADLVRRLPQGLDTDVGERGGRFSGGERQRMALARALVRQPRILVLDEATSALDGQGEGEFLHTLSRLTQQSSLTVIAVTHRMKLAPLADKVMVIKAGRLEAEGQHESLLASSADYAELWRQALPA